MTSLFSGQGRHISIKRHLIVLNRVFASDLHKVSRNSNNLNNNYYEYF